MADHASSSSSRPRGDNDSISRGTKKQKIEKGIKILQLDKQISSIEHPAVANNVVPLLELGDALALGSCSKYLNGLCECETTWKEWYKKRWGPVVDSEGATKGWKYMYSQQHKKKRNEIFETLGPVINSMADGELYSRDFLREVETLKRLDATFEDVYFFLFSKDLDVGMNLIGLYYCFFELRVPADDILNSIVRCQLADRQACVSWCLPKNWSYGFYLPEENYSKVVSLRQILENSQSNVLFIFKQAASQVASQMVNKKQLGKVRVSGKIPEPEPEEPEEPPCGECEACKRNTEILAERNNESGEKMDCGCDFCKGKGILEVDESDESDECGCEKCKGNNEIDESDEMEGKGKGVIESDESEEVVRDCEKCKEEMEIEDEESEEEDEMACDGDAGPSSR